MIGCSFCDITIESDGSQHHESNCPTLETTRLRAEVERLRERSEDHAAEVLELRERLDRPKCFYCSFGEEGKRATFDQLQQHIETCAAHPMAVLQAEVERLKANTNEGARVLIARIQKLEHERGEAQREALNWCTDLTSERDEHRWTRTELNKALARVTILVHAIGIWPHGHVVGPKETCALCQAVLHTPARARALLDVAEAARKFEQKLALVQEAIDGAFVFQALHSFSYRGENYGEELKMLRDALARWTGAT